MSQRTQSNIHTNNSKLSTNTISNNESGLLCLRLLNREHEIWTAWPQKRFRDIQRPLAYKYLGLQVWWTIFMMAIILLVKSLNHRDNYVWKLTWCHFGGQDSSIPVNFSRVDQHSLCHLCNLLIKARHESIHGLHSLGFSNLVKIQKPNTAQGQMQQFPSWVWKNQTAKELAKKPCRSSPMLELKLFFIIGICRTTQFAVKWLCPEAFTKSKCGDKATRQETSLFVLSSLNRQLEYEK